MARILTLILYKIKVKSIYICNLGIKIDKKIKS
jgi:hypothetical protein